MKFVTDIAGFIDSLDETKAIIQRLHPAMQMGVFDKLVLTEDQAQAAFELRFKIEAAVKFGEQFYYTLEETHAGAEEIHRGGGLKLGVENLVIPLLEIQARKTLRIVRQAHEQIKALHHSLKTATEAEIAKREAATLAEIEASYPRPE
ncbi:MAG: hypothetical protein ACRCV6_07765 [Formosimonas sp.]